MFGVDSTQGAFPEPWWNQWTAVDQTAAGRGLISHYDAMIASHIHVAQVVRIPGQPSQIVVGNGGSIPDFLTGYTRPQYGPLAPLTPTVKPYPNLEYLWTQTRYGYVVAEPGARAHRWTLTQKTVRGTTYAKCRMVGKKTRCHDRRSGPGLG
ncbi:MAG: hypothetical protein U0R64_06900 [Candidatus Nanopelagicales bacterium]